MDAESINKPPEDQLPVEKMSAVSRITKIFYEPTSVFKTLNGKLDWLIPLLIIGILGGGVYHFTRPVMSRDMKTNVMRNMEKYRQYMSEEQFNETMAQVESQFEEAIKNPFKWYYPPLFIGLPFVFMSIIALIGLLSGNFIFGGKCSFWIVLNVVAYSALIGFLGDIVNGIMVIAKDTMYVYTGLGLIKPVDDGSFLYYLLRQIDVFSIWRIIVTFIGLGIIYKMKPKKFAYVIVPIWLIFIALIAVGNVFSGGTIVY